MFQLQPDYTEHLAPPQQPWHAQQPLWLLSPHIAIHAPAVRDEDLPATELLNMYTAHLAPPQTHQHELLSPCLPSLMTSFPASAGWVPVGGGLRRFPPVMPIVNLATMLVTMLVQSMMRRWPSSSCRMSWRGCVWTS